MATRAPDWARRSAIPRPMRLALPVTRITRPSREAMSSLCLGGWIAVHFNLIGSDSIQRRFRQFAGEVGPAPPECRGHTEYSGDGSDDARAYVIGGPTGDAHRNHHGHPGPGFDGGEDAAAIFVGDVAQQLR